MGVELTKGVKRYTAESTAYIQDGNAPNINSFNWMVKSQEIFNFLIHFYNVQAFIIFN